MSKLWKMFREKKHKWYLGYRSYKPIIIILNILFISIIIDLYILLVLIRALWGYYIAMPIPLGTLLNHL